MFYFGPWDSAGHYVCDESGHSVDRETERSLPWGCYGDVQHPIDCCLQPGCYKDRDGRIEHRGQQIEGPAILHHRGGWTALGFWDRTIDTRSNSNSVYIAEGTFTFDEMVFMARTRFAHRWNKMRFEVFQVDSDGSRVTDIDGSRPSGEGEKE